MTFAQRRPTHDVVMRFDCHGSVTSRPLIAINVELPQPAHLCAQIAGAIRWPHPFPDRSQAARPNNSCRRENDAAVAAGTAQDADVPSFETLDHVARALMARVDARRIAARAGRRMVRLGCRICRARQAGNWNWRCWPASMPARLCGAGNRVTATATVPRLPPDAGDRRFADPAWQKMPYLFWQQAFLAQEEWWRNATRQVRGQRPRAPRASPSWRGNCSTASRRPMFPGSIR